MRTEGLKAQVGYKHRPGKYGTKPAVVAANQLQQNFSVDAPNSVYTHIDQKTGRATQNAIYDINGDVIGHVDFKNHGKGARSGHGHVFPTPGDPSTGHGKGKPHIPNSSLPSGWDTLPSGVKPLQPIGT